MDRTTDEAVAAALRAARSRTEAETPRPADLPSPRPAQANRHRRGIDLDGLSEHGRRILNWLVDWDEPTIEGIVELVAATRAAAEGAAHRVTLDAQPIARPNGEAVAADHPSDGRP